MCFLQNGSFCNVLLGFAFPPSHIWQRSFHVSLHQPWASWPSSLAIYPGSQQSVLVSAVSFHFLLLTLPAVPGPSAGSPAAAFLVLHPPGAHPPPHTMW